MGQAFGWGDVIRMLTGEYHLDDEEAEDVVKMLKKKNGVDRCIFIYRLFGMNQEEIARMLSITQQAVSKRLSGKFGDIIKYLSAKGVEHEQEDNAYAGAVYRTINGLDEGPLVSFGGILEDDYSEESSP
jgi:transcriptional regulator with XRE-family HTH domain